MAGETIKSEGICLAIFPWSRTSHVVTWLTPAGRVVTVVKGAVRPKSAFLGQYDLNYTCDLVYYARAKGESHALRECAPVNRRDDLRENYAALAVADYFRFLADRLAPQGPDCAAWYALLNESLDGLCSGHPRIRFLRYELAVLHLMGLDPTVEADSGAFALKGERRIPVSPEVAALIRALSPEPTERAVIAREDLVRAQAVSDALRALGAYYDYHVDGVTEVRRTALHVVGNRPNICYNPKP